jgi:hypothetical protein
LSKPFYGLHALGSLWRDLRASLGNWHNVYTRFSRWGKKGVWEHVSKASARMLICNRFCWTARLFRLISMPPAPQKRGRTRDRTLARAIESTTIYMASDALTNPVSWQLTCGWLFTGPNAARVIVWANTAVMSSGHTAGCFM